MIPDFDTITVPNRLRTQRIQRKTRKFEKKLTEIAQSKAKKHCGKELVSENVSITMEDSSEYLVYEKDVSNNNSYSCGTVDMLGRNMGEVLCFNRIIDPEQIATVTVKGIMDQESTVIIF